MATTLRALASQVTAAHLRGMGYGPELDGLQLEWLCKMMHARGPLNYHLAMPMLPRGHHPDSPRAMPLNPDVPVYGNFLLLGWHGHNGYFTLDEFSSRKQIAAAIGSPAGVLNDYVDFQVAWEYGRVLPFRVHYTNGQGVRKILDKRALDPPPCLYGTEIVVDWLDGQ